MSPLTVWINIGIHLSLEYSCFYFSALPLTKATQNLCFNVSLHKDYAEVPIESCMLLSMIDDKIDALNNIGLIFNINLARERFCVLLPGLNHLKRLIDEKFRFLKSLL